MTIGRRAICLAIPLTLAACALRSPCEPADLRPIEGAAYVVVRSDYISSAVALLDARGETLSEAWVDSGTVAPGLVAPLSGDVVVPSDTLVPGTVTLIDRYNADTLALLWLDGSRTLQIDLRGDPRDDYPLGYSANPQDALAVGEGQAIVSRLNPNPDGSAPLLARGNDLALVDLELGRVVDRISLEADQEITVDTPTGPATQTAYARPSGLAWLDRTGRRVVVGLSRLTRSFQDAAPGMVAVLDLDSREVQRLPIEGLTNCAHVDAAPDRPEVIVLCQGATFTLDDEGRREGAGIAIVSIRSGAAQAHVVWRAADHPELPVPSDGLVALPGRRLVANARGSTAGLADRLVYLELDTGASRTLADSPEAFSFGVAVLSPDASTVRVPDSAGRAIHRFGMEASGPLPQASEIIEGCRLLGPRALGRL